MRTASKNNSSEQRVDHLGRSSACGSNSSPGARRAFGLILSCLVVVGSAPASAESLKDALSAAYGYNPRLDAQRAFQRGTDEDVARAMSGYRPTVTGNADIGIERTDQLEYLVDQGAGLGQGYLFGRPMPATEIEALAA